MSTTDVDEEMGIKLIRGLQARVGIVESEDDARRGWRRMTEAQRAQTVRAYRVLCGELPA